ncbi:hypothetical protein [Shouchella lehensis]|uniref:Uncharacterized protein n=1 Tax=Shouchella lehensis TaxID=300825 RepID=A0A4Y7WMI5_9BACI|nr:hypothetical protein [Shouchella lehensis]MBG9783064.1 hypothetical protein [Shouchella lehensis]TES49577.1 hypothetical protein E2L03_08920 [Shouchella lehensis]
MSLPLQLQQLFTEKLTVHKRYRFSIKEQLHMMDTAFIVNEIITASEEEMEILFPILTNMSENEDALHDYLEYLATIYVQTNERHSTF